MNPWVVKIGVVVLLSSVSCIYYAWKTRRNSPQPAQYTNIGSYDGSNMNSCPICLTEFRYFDRHEVISLPCRHKVCRECITTMFYHQVQNGRNCPQCRQLVSENFIKLFQL